MLHPYVQSGKPTVGSTAARCRGAYRPSRGETDRLAKQPGSLTDGPDWGEGAAQSHAVRERLTPSQFTWKATTSFPQFGTSAPSQACTNACAALRWAASWGLKRRWPSAPAVGTHSPRWEILQRSGASQRDSYNDAYFPEDFAGLNR